MWYDPKNILVFNFSELNLNFLEGFSKNNIIFNFMDIRPMGTDFFHGRRTDMQRAFIGNLRHLLQFCERASKERISMLSVSLEITIFQVFAQIVIWKLKEEGSKLSWNISTIIWLPTVFVIPIRNCRFLH